MLSTSIYMRKHCAICDKTSSMAGTRKLLRGNYNPTSRVRKYPNLQWIRLPRATKGHAKGARILACTSCIKALAKNK